MADLQSLQGLRWVRLPASHKSVCWKPVYVLTEADAEHADNKYYIVKSIDGKYSQYHRDELHESLDYGQCGKKQMYHLMLQSLHHLFARDTIGTQQMYMSASTEPATWNILNYFATKSSKEADDEQTMHDLHRVTDIEFHCDSFAADESQREEFETEAEGNRQINAIWLKTECMTEAKYCSLSRIRTIHYVDDDWQHVFDPCDEVKVCDMDFLLDADDDDDDVDDEEEEEQEQANQFEQEIQALELERSKSARLIQDLQQENERLAASASSSSSNDSHHLHYEALLAEKQQEIDKLRRELIARSNAKQLDSKFPTVEEVCSAYRSIKNQEFQSVHSKLTKPLRKMHRDWNKYYVNQLSHRLLFETLIECYRQTLAYQHSIYSSIARILCVEHEQDESGNTAATLEFLFHRYLTNNFEQMRESKQMKQIKQETVLQSVREKYGEIVNALSSEQQSELFGALSAYISKCCDVCWSMVLQRPVLSISPSVFMPAPTDKVEFDERRHSRVLGSNKKDKYILYYVWPAIARNNCELDTIKPYVIQRDSDFPAPTSSC